MNPLNKKIVVAFIAIWAHFMAPSFSLGATPLEYQIKAAFIYNFVKFVEWPARDSGQTKDPVVIGVLGDSPILEALQSIIIKKNQRGKIKVKQVQEPEDLKKSHVLFISRSDKTQLQSTIDALNQSNVLTISEVKKFAEMGGMINFFLEKEKIRFEINPEAAEKAELKISSKILRLARIVQTQRSSREN